MKIGRLLLKNNVFLAPMAGVTDLPFRTIVREFGCGLAFTEMVSAAGLIRGTGKTCRYLDSSPADRPLGVQLFGVDPETLAAAAKSAAEKGADLLDMNMGCPVKKVVKTGAGAALMRDPQRATAILRALRGASDLPLTVKIRAGWRQREINALDIGRIAEECGADAVILHPRTADQGFGGRSDWGLIAALKAHLGIPVIGSGDIRRPEDAALMFKETGCDGVMVGRGALGNPWIVGNILSHLSGGDVSSPSLAEREETIRRHLALVIDYYGEKVGTRDFRKHLLWYTKGLRGGAQFRKAAGKIKDLTSTLAALQEYFQALG
ncbi:MAG: tRNA dihydrouridine synthase DusB [Proteobacteria bacterium]|nr:tRNA dihydrouridine synthase DusB [Pseudomonadota bacterium]MBU2228466.1 tRNA dihydrouridine synthase DusB [Pseudomonadota bacterium]